MIYNKLTALTAATVTVAALFVSDAFAQYGRPRFDGEFQRSFAGFRDRDDFRSRFRDRDDFRFRFRDRDDFRFRFRDRDDFRFRRCGPWNC
jgi:hypothetical protein